MTENLYFEFNGVLLKLKIENNKCTEIFTHTAQSKMTKDSKTEFWKSLIQKSLKNKLTLKEFAQYFEAQGTPFQLKVWSEMRRIPYGKTISYKTLAQNIKHPKAFRAVAGACGRNPLLLVIQCHRVVASNGLGGFSCGVDLKVKFLHSEDVTI